jgi:predicted Zn-dependent peptidase
MLYENTPFQYPVDDISYHRKRFPYKEVVAFYRENYIPANMVLSITTHLSFAKVLSMVKRTHFSKGRMPLEPSLHMQLLPQLYVPPPINGIKYRIKNMQKMRSIYLNVSFQTCNQLQHNEKYILHVFASILCNNSLASRLGDLLRQKHGLVYGVYVTTSYNESGGDFTVSTQFDGVNFIKKTNPSVLPLIVTELNTILRNGVREKEVTVSKHNIRGRILLDLENIDTQTNYNGVQMLLFHDAANIVPYSQLYEKCYAPITKAQINTCVRKYFVKRRMCVTVVGNNLPSLDVISRECERFIE